MGFWQRVKNFVVTGISVVSRVIYNSGQGLYSLGKVMDYLKVSSHTAAKAGIGVGVAGTAISTLLTKTIPTHAQVSSSHAGDGDAELQPLGWGGWLTSGALRSSGMVYGGMSAVSAYFLTTVISEGLNSLVSEESGVALWKEILIQISAVIVAGATFYNYYTNDYRYIRQNTRVIGEGVDERHFPLNKSMAKTLATSSLNLATYPMQAYFFSKPAIDKLPYVGKALGSVGSNIVGGLASAATFLTVVTWLPSVYKHFNEPPGHNDHQASAIPVNCQSISYKIASYASGAVDSIGSNGLGPFISVIFTLNNLYGLNPYGWIIGIAALCALNAAFMNLLFSVKEGTNSTLQLAYPPDAEVVADDEVEPLLRPGTNDLEAGTEVQTTIQDDSTVISFYSPQSQRSASLMFATPTDTQTTVPVAETSRAVNLRHSK